MTRPTCPLPPATYLRLKSPALDGCALFFLRRRQDDYAILSNDTRTAFIRPEQLLITERPRPLELEAPLRAYGRLFPKDDGAGPYFGGYVGLMIPTLKVLGPEAVPLLEIADPLEETEAGVQHAIAAEAKLFGPEADVILSMLEIRAHHPRHKATA